MNKILSFGEILIRKQSVGNHFFKSPDNLLKIYPGGSEANVAVSLAQMGEEVQYVSAFPKNKLSEEILAYIEAFSVDNSKVIWSGDRIGSYILLSANGLSSGEVIYDRKYSSFSLLDSNDLDIAQLLEGVTWFHWSALTPALNENMAKLMKAILTEASNRGIYISVDLNYRSKLWQYGKQPLDIMPELVQYCDLIMGNIWASNKMLGSTIDEQFNRQTSQSAYFDFAKENAKELFSMFPKAKLIANTFRFIDHPQHNLFYGTLHTKQEDVISKTYETQEAVDRIGSGDAFMAGLIYACRQGMNNQDIIETATGTGYYKLFVEGDFGNGKFK